MEENNPAFQEQLNGLLDLLQAVGIHDVEHKEVKKASLALNKQGIGAPIVFPADIPEAKEMNDVQIEAMILKLQQAQSPTPALMEALEDYVSHTKGGSMAGSKRGTRKKKKNGTYQPKKQYNFVKHYAPSQQQQLQQHQQPQQEDYFQEHEESEDFIYNPQELLNQEPQQFHDDHDDFDEDEEDDDFDEEADYPVVGPGMGDDVSVVSDMTTPTVVSSLNINDEENYTGIVQSPFGGGARRPIGQPQGGKKKNLVSSRPMPGIAAGMRVGPPIAAIGGGGAGNPSGMRVGPPMAIGGGPGGGLNSSQHSSGAGGAAAKRRQNYQQTMSRLHENPQGMTMAGPRVNPRAVTGGVPALSGDHNTEDLFAQGGGGRQTPQRTSSGSNGQREQRQPLPPRAKSATSNKMRQRMDATNGQDWTEFDDAPAQQQQAKRNSGSGKPKKKGTKKSSSSGAGETSKKKSSGGGAPTSPTKSKNNNDGSTKVKKKVVKKKVVKRPAGEGTPSKRTPGGSGKSSSSGSRRPVS